MWENKYDKLHYLIRSDATITEMLQAAFDQGCEYGKKEARREIAEELNPLSANLGNAMMTSIPPSTTVRLLPKLRILSELAPDTLQLRITVQSMRDNSKDGQGRNEIVLYTSFDLKREEVPGFVAEACREAIEGNYCRNYTHINKEQYMKGIWT